MQAVHARPAAVHHLQVSAQLVVCFSQREQNGARRRKTEEGTRGIGGEGRDGRDKAEF